MNRIAAVIIGVLVAAPVWALDIGAMTPEEREIFRQEVRAYLLDHPEVIFEAVDIYEQRQNTAQAGADKAMITAHAALIFDDGFSWIGGNPQGDLTVVEFVDYRCAYCRRAFPEVHELIATDGNIRYILKEFPILGEQSTLAARFAIAVRQVSGAEAYKDAHDRLMTMRNAVDQASLNRIAVDLGLDPAAILARMTSDAVDRELAANRDLGRKLEINGTPSFVFQSEMLRGYVPLDGMREIVARLRGG